MMIEVKLEVTRKTDDKLVVMCDRSNSKYDHHHVRHGEFIAALSEPRVSNLERGGFPCGEVGKASSPNAIEPQSKVDIRLQIQSRF